MVPAGLDACHLHQEPAANGAGLVPQRARGDLPDDPVLVLQPTAFFVRSALAELRLSVEACEETSAALSQKLRSTFGLDAKAHADQPVRRA